LGAVGARLEDGREVTAADLEPQPVELVTDRGEVKLIVEPIGTVGYEDLRCAAMREPLGRGLRPSVASTDDLARMLGARGREEGRAKLWQVRQLGQLERGVAVEL